MKIYQSRYFHYEELVSPEFCELLFIDNKIYTIDIEKLIDIRIINGLNAIRDHFNRGVIVNNYLWGGSLKYRGLRPSNHDSAKLSKHKFGQAVDFNVKGLTSSEVVESILKNWNKFNKFFTRMENPNITVTWTHLDCASVEQSTLEKPYIFNP